MGAERHRTNDPLVTAFENASAQHHLDEDGSLRLNFNTYHPQAMEVVGDRVLGGDHRATRLPEPIDGYDRSPGKGVGHLFVLEDGTLVKDIVLGGGRHVPPRRPRRGPGRRHCRCFVAEYRPDSESIIYKVDPSTFEAQKIFTVDVSSIVPQPGGAAASSASPGAHVSSTWTTSGRRSRSPNNSRFVKL